MVIKASDFFLDLAWDKNVDSVTLHVPTDNVGIQTIPTARLHLPPGSTSPYSAPLKFTAGDLLSVEENGAVEFDGEKLYITIQNERKSFSFSDIFQIEENYIPKFTTSGLDPSILYQDNNKILLSGDLEAQGLTISDPITSGTLQIGVDSTSSSIQSSRDLELGVDGDGVILSKNVMLFDNNKYVLYSTNLTNLGDSGMIRLKWTENTGKPAIVWFDQDNNRQAAIVAHDYLSYPDNQHKHISIETSDESGSLQTRFAIKWGMNNTIIKTSDAQFWLGGSYPMTLGTPTENPSYGSPGLELYRSGSDTEIEITEASGTKEARLHLRRGTRDWVLINTGDFTIECEESELFRINRSGYIGVLLSTPVYVLDVNGDINVSSSNRYKIAGTNLNVVAGNGLTGGGDLSPGVTLTLGTPGTLTSTTTNAVTTSSHTHSITGFAATPHALVGADHSASGLTTGYFLKATSATQFGFAAHGLTATDVGAVPTSRSVIAGNGLTGGGALTADVTVTMGTPATLTSTTTNAVTTSSHTHSVSGFVITGRNITAGNGLTGGGDLSADRTITLGTPGTITSTSTNAVTTSSHTHALSVSFSVDILELQVFT